jgi:hypothetical protein
MGRGILLTLAGFIIVFGIVEGSVHRRQRQAAARTPDYYYAEQSRNIAFSTMEAAISKFNGGWSLGKGEKWDTSVFNGTGIVTYYKHPIAFGSRLFVEVQGIILHDTTTIRAVINRPAFSQYAYFTNDEGSVNFASGDTLYGPVHTNGTFNMDGHPVFYGKVSSPHEPNDRGANPEYNGGTNFDSYNIDLPSDLSNISDDARDGGYHFDDKIKVVFKDDGTADITRYQRDCIEWWGRRHRYCRKRGSTPIDTTNYNLQPSNNFNGIISSSKNIEVKGTLAGGVKITVHSQQDIHIIGDLTYQDFDPTQDYSETKLSSNNLLGLVSQNNIIVDDGAETIQNSVTSGTTSDTQGLYITASIMASQGSFTVQDYNDRGIGFRGDLFVLGGVIQKDRGPVGLVGNTAGYSKYYTYDKRFQTNQTPDFPEVKRFSVDSWRETTR